MGSCAIGSSLMANEIARVETPIETTLESVERRYSGSPMARALFQLIPYLGAPVDALLTGSYDKVKERRAAELIKQLRDEIDRLDKSKINRAFVESAEFNQLLLEGCRRASECYEDDKIRTFARFLANG